jgi:hypothetical protein
MPQPGQQLELIAIHPRPDNSLPIQFSVLPPFPDSPFTMKLGHTLGE